MSAIVVERVVQGDAEFDQHAWDLLELGAGPIADTEAARLYWDPWQIAEILLHRPGTPGYSDLIREARGSLRGHCGVTGACFTTEHRGVRFTTWEQYFTPGAGQLITWRRLAEAVRATADARPDEAAALFRAVIGYRAAITARTDDSAAKFRAQQAAVAAFWGDSADTREDKPA